MGHEFNPRLNSGYQVWLTTGAGVKLDITQIVAEVNVIESIFENFIYGWIDIADTDGFLEKNQIIGQKGEEIAIEIHSPNQTGDPAISFIKEFDINSLTDLKMDNTGTGLVSYRLGFTSHFIGKSNNIRINRSFSQMTPTEIVEYICIDILEMGLDVKTPWENIVTLFPSRHARPVVVPGWSPVKTINFLCQHAISAEEDDNYIFFENSEGFHFMPIEELKYGTVKRGLSVSGRPSVEDSVTIDENGEGRVQGQLAELFSQPKRFNHTESQLNGLYGGNLTTHNILEKRIKNFEVLYDGVNEAFIGFSGLDGAGTVTTSSVPNYGYMSDNYFYDVQHKTEKNHYVRRDMKISELKTLISTFEMAGDTNIIAGDLISIDVPTKDKSNKLMGIDLMISGEYLVASIHHVVHYKDGYSMTIEAVKDGFENEPV
jgi:hypothetical protein